MQTFDKANIERGDTETRVQNFYGAYYQTNHGTIMRKGITCKKIPL